MIRFRLAAVLVAAAAVAPVRADEKSHRMAVEEMFQTMQMERQMDLAIDQVMEMQIKANPMLEPVKGVMRKFFAKHLAYAGLKDELVKIYAAEFTEAEVKELTAFYKTPAGKKTIEKMPVLMRRGGELGMKRVQDNQAELQRMIQEALSGKKDN